MATSLSFLLHCSLILILSLSHCVTCFYTPCTGHPDDEPPPPVYYEHIGFRDQYTAGADPTLPSSYLPRILAAMQTYVDGTLENAPSTWECEYGSYVYYGGAGRALGFLKVYRFHLLIFVSYFSKLLFICW